MDTHTNNFELIEPETNWLAPTLMAVVNKQIHTITLDDDELIKFYRAYNLIKEREDITECTLCINGTPLILSRHESEELVNLLCFYIEIETVFCACASMSLQ